MKKKKISKKKKIKTFDRLPKPKYWRPHKCEQREGHLLSCCAHPSMFSDLILNISLTIFTIFFIWIHTQYCHDNGDQSDETKNEKKINHYHISTVSYLKIRVHEKTKFCRRFCFATSSIRCTYNFLLYIFFFFNE